MYHWNPGRCSGVSLLSDNSPEAEHNQNNARLKKSPRFILKPGIRHLQVLTLRVLSAAQAEGMQCTSCTVVKMHSMSATVSCGYKLRVQPDICSIFMFKCIVQQTVSYVIRAGIRHSNIPADSRTLGGWMMRMRMRRMSYCPWWGLTYKLPGQWRHSSRIVFNPQSIYYAR